MKSLSFRFDSEENNRFKEYRIQRNCIDIHFSDLFSHLLTCGSDGDVRIWKGIDDDDPVSHRAGDNALAIAYKVI